MAQCAGRYAGGGQVHGRSPLRGGKGFQRGELKPALGAQVFGGELRAAFCVGLFEEPNIWELTDTFGCLLMVVAIFLEAVGKE